MDGGKLTVTVENCHIESFKVFPQTICDLFDKM